MQLYPTRTAAHLAIAASAVALVGVAAREPAIVGWGGAMLVAVALARAATLVSVARIRAAGFEMLWTGARRVVRTPRGTTVEIEAEVRNRDSLSARYVKLRAVASSQLDVKIEPAQGEVAASGRLKVKVKVVCPRVGQHGVHGLALEVHGASGLFEVPLTFANPYGVEVMPRPFAAYLLQPRGGRSHLMAAAGKPGRSRGEGNELRELREHQPGDPFRRIAWKASARRGRLLVRDYEREERDVVWILLDASVELWSGPPGRAPLDLAIDEASSVAARHLARGDRVGLMIFGGGLNERGPAGSKARPAQGARIAHALTVGCGTYDAERSDLDEADVALRVLEHLRPLDSRGLTDVRRGDLDKLATRAEAMRARAPFSAAAPAARSSRERALRRYLASFGIESPARIDRAKEAGQRPLVAEALLNVARSKPRASRVHVVAPPPETRKSDAMGEAVRRVTRIGATITWTTPPVEPALAPPWQDPSKKPGEEEPLFRRRGRDFKELAPIAAAAVGARAQAARVRREAALRKLGIRVVRLRHVRSAHETEEAPEPTPAPAKSA